MESLPDRDMPRSSKRSCPSGRVSRGKRLSALPAERRSDSVVPPGDERTSEREPPRPDRGSASNEPLGEDPKNGRCCALPGRRDSSPLWKRSPLRSRSGRREYSCVTFGRDGVEGRSPWDRPLPPPRTRASPPRSASRPTLGGEPEGRKIEDPARELGLIDGRPSRNLPPAGELLRPRGAICAGDERRADDLPTDGADRLDPRLIPPPDRDRDCPGEIADPPPPRNPPRLSPERPPPRFSPERPPPRWATASRVVAKNRAVAATPDHRILLNLIAVPMSKKARQRALDHVHL